MRFFKKKTYDSFIAWSKTLDRRVSSAAIIFENTQGQVLIVKANYKAYWTFPGGIIDKGETPKEAALREASEEVGIHVNPEELEFAGVVTRRSEVAQTYQFLFKARLTKAMVDHIVLQKSELDEYALVTRADVAGNDRVYSKAVKDWSQGIQGYAEQQFDSQQNG